MLRPGNAFFPLAAGPLAHVTIVLTDPSGDPAHVVTVNLTTKTTVSDPTVTLNVGDHPSVVHPTSVAYDYLQFSRESAIQDSLRNGTLVPSVDFAADVLEYIQQGACKSKRGARDVREYCKRLFNSP